MAEPSSTWLNSSLSVYEETISRLFWTDDLTTTDITTRLGQSEFRLTLFNVTNQSLIEAIVWNDRWRNALQGHSVYQNLYAMAHWQKAFDYFDEVEKGNGYLTQDFDYGRVSHLQRTL